MGQITLYDESSMNQKSDFSAFIPLIVVLVAGTVLISGCQTDSSATSQQKSAKVSPTLEILLRDSQFVQNNATIWAASVNVNNTVVFRNDDDSSHSLFSVSESKPFQLGQTRRGESGRVVFDRPGVVNVQCEFHSAMRLELTVKSP